METNLGYVLEATSPGSCGSRTRLFTGSKHQEPTETTPRRPHQHFIHPDAAQQHHDCSSFHKEILVKRRTERDVGPLRYPRHAVACQGGLRPVVDLEGWRISRCS